MVLYFVIIFIVLMFSIKPCFKNNNEDYLSKDTTNIIKGIFLLIVFFSHFKTYVTLTDKIDTLAISICNLLGQLMVTMFLFYSGYGVFISIKNKENYIKSIPKKRMLKTLLNFDIAVLIFLILNLIIKNYYPAKTILLSFIGWESIGNSNWYIFSILILYLLTYISFSIFKKDNRMSLACLWILSIIFIAVISIFKETYWYDTVLCYPLGMTYALYKDTIEDFLKKNVSYYITLIGSLILFFITYSLMKYNHYIFEICAILFSIIIVLITRKIKLKNKLFKWVGENLFWMYILQRLPMLLIKNINISINRYLYFIISIISTILLTLIVKYTMILIDKTIKILKKKEYTK